MITIVDFGMGNLGSVRSMLARAGFESLVTADPRDVERATKLVLPGVGSFDRAMQNLGERGLVDVLHDHALRRGTPILGICLGMQLLCESSEEGSLRGLGWFDAQCVRLSPGSDMRIPHMGWNSVDIRQSSPILDPTDAGARFYFVHGYRVECSDPGLVVATTTYGEEFVSVIGRANIFGTQFHPEKSHRHGLKLLDKFARWS